jgi:hypothetical protein
MIVKNRVILLKNKHAAIDSNIKEENSNILSDDLFLNALKKKKLLIKDEIFRLKHAS